MENSLERATMRLLIDDQKKQLKEAKKQRNIPRILFCSEVLQQYNKLYKQL